MAKSTQMAFLNVEMASLLKSSEIMRAIAHPLRMKIMGYIDKNKSVNVNKIYNALGLEQSITSQHLRILRTADLVKTKREGKFIYYSLNYDKIAKVHAMIEKHNMA